MEKKYQISSQVIVALEIAQNITEQFKMPAIPVECFAFGLFTEPDSSLFKMLTQIGTKFDDLNQNVLDSIFAEETTLYVNKAVSLTLENKDKYIIDELILDVIDLAQTVSNENEESIISIDNIITAFGDYFSEMYSYITSNLLFNSSLLEKPLLLGSNSFGISASKFYLPTELSGFLSIMNDDYSPDETTCPICGRDEELDKILTVLTKQTKRNAIFVGAAGVGKTAIVEKFVWNIVTNNCPEQFKDSIVLKLDVTALISGTMYRGTAEEKFINLINFLEKNENCILFIDEIHLILGAGACKEGELDLANALKPILARGKTRVIGATTEQEYEKYFSQDSALKRRFEKVLVKEPSSKDVYDMIKNQVAILSEKHHVTVTKSTVNSAIFYANCFFFNEKNPDKTLSILDMAMAKAELKGKKKLTKNDILDVTSIYKKMFNKMSFEQKKAVAYHEAGHYLVTKFSPELNNINLLAVSIIPAEHYLGVNVFEIDDEIICNDNLDYFIAEMASKLAGRIAESMYTKDITAGACSDLEKASSIAKDIILKFGFDPKIGNRFYNEREVAGKFYEEVNNSIGSYVKKAEAYANSILKEHEEQLELLANSLVEKGIMSNAEVCELLNIN